MAGMTVQQLAQVLNLPVERLLAQFKEAGLKPSKADSEVNPAEKVKFLEFLRSSHGKAASTESVRAPSQITLKRKTVNEISVSPVGGGKSLHSNKTVSVEVRQKRTYVQRTSVNEPSNEMDQERADAIRKLGESKLRAESEESVRREQEAKRQVESQKRVEEEQKKAPEPEKAPVVEVHHVESTPPPAASVERVQADAAPEAPVAETVWSVDNVAWPDSGCQNNGKANRSCNGHERPRSRVGRLPGEE